MANVACWALFGRGRRADLMSVAGGEADMMQEVPRHVSDGARRGTAVNFNDLASGALGEIRTPDPIQSAGWQALSVIR